jgi:hypothetical protein
MNLGEAPNPQPPRIASDLTPALTAADPDATPCKALFPSSYGASSSSLVRLQPDGNLRAPDIFDSIGSNLDERIDQEGKHAERIEARLESLQEELELAES